MSPGQNQRRVGAYVFDPDTGELSREGATHTLRPQASRLLELLVQRSGRLVTRDELRDWVWPDGRWDSDLGLNVCVTQLRAAFGDDAEAPAYIETLRGRGYRLIAEVGDPRRAHSKSGAVALLAGALMLAAVVAGVIWLAGGSSVSAAPPIRLAVLPFRSIPDSDSLLYLREGLAEDLITALANANPGRLAVIGRTSSFDLDAEGLSPADIAAQLDADYVLRGTIRQTALGHRITAQLLDVESGTYAWSTGHDLETGPVTDVDRQIATNLLTALAVPASEMSDLRVASSAEPSGAASARDAVLRARYLRGRFTRADSRRAIEALDEALGRHPGHVEAMIEAASNHLVLGEIEEAERRLAQAREADGQAPGVDHVAGRIALYGRGDPWAAAKALARAAHLQPGTAEIRHDYAQALLATGRSSEAMQEGELALDLDPVSSTVRGDIGWVFYYARSYGRARATCRATLELLSNSISAQKCLVLAAYFEGTLPEEVGVVEEFLTALRASANDRQMVLASINAGDSQALWRWLAENALGAGQLGAIDEARVLAFQGRHEEAAALLVALGAGPGPLLFVAHDPVFETTRRQPAFVEALRRVGLARALVAADVD